MSEYKAEYMKEALVVAQDAYDHLEVPVGCVFVLDNKSIIAKGRNQPNESYNATRHAEIVAIDSILEKHDPTVFENVDLYVTVEPCVMCASALRQIGIRHVYFGCGNEKFGGNGSVFNINTDSRLNTTQSKSYPSEGGYFHEEAILLLRKFYIRENKHAPVPRKKTNRVLKTEVIPMNKIERKYLTIEETIPPENYRPLWIFVATLAVTYRRVLTLIKESVKIQIIF